jgi:hypothetical protein
MEIWFQLFVSRQKRFRDLRRHVMQDGGERKRDRSDESCEASIESEMTKAQMQTCKKLVANGAKYQGLSFNPTMTTIKVTNVRQVFATTFRDFEFDHGDGLVSTCFGCFARAVCDERNGTLFPHWYAFRIHQWLR